MSGDKIETVRRLISLAVDERGNVEERRAASYQAVAMIHKYKMRVMTDDAAQVVEQKKQGHSRGRGGGPSTWDDFERKARDAQWATYEEGVVSRAAKSVAHDSATGSGPETNAEPVRSDGKWFAFNKPLRLIERTGDSTLFSYAEEEPMTEATWWIPHRYLRSVQASSSPPDGDLYDVVVSVRWARLAGVTDYGTVTDE